MTEPRAREPMLLPLEGEIIKPKKAGRKAGSALPEDWAPSNGDRDYGHGHGLSDREIDGIAEEMKLWAGANAHRQVARKASWSLAFKGWMLREAKKGRSTNGGGRNGHRMTMADIAMGGLREDR